MYNLLNKSQYKCLKRIIKIRETVFKVEKENIEDLDIIQEDFFELQKKDGYQDEDILLRSNLYCYLTRYDVKYLYKSKYIDITNYLFDEDDRLVILLFSPTTAGIAFMNEFERYYVSKRISFFTVLFIILTFLSQIIFYFI